MLRLYVKRETAQNKCNNKVPKLLLSEIKVVFYQIRVRRLTTLTLANAGIPAKSPLSGERQTGGPGAGKQSKIRKATYLSSDIKRVSPLVLANPVTGRGV